MIEATDKNFYEVTAGDKLVIVDFWAEWCGPCRAITPVLEELANTYKDELVVAKLNVDTNSESMVRFAITAIPSILFFKGGELVGKHVGATSKSVLESKVKNFL